MVLNQWIGLDAHNGTPTKGRMTKGRMTEGRMTKGRKFIR